MLLCCIPRGAAASSSHGSRGAAVPSMFQQPLSSTRSQQQRAAQQQLDVFGTPAPQRAGAQGELQQHKQASAGHQQQHSSSALASDASPTPDQAGAAAATADGRQQQSKSVAPGLRSNGSRGGAVAAAAASGSSTEDGDMGGAGGTGPARRKGTALTSQRAAAQPYGAKAAFARNTPYARFAAGKLGAGAGGSAAAAAAGAGGAAPSNPLLQRGVTGSRPPRPGPFAKLPPAPNALAGGARQQQQQQSAGAEVFLNAAWNSRQMRSGKRPGTPWASLPGELHPGRAGAMFASTLLTSCCTVWCRLLQHDGARMCSTLLAVGVHTC